MYSSRRRRSGRSRSKTTIIRRSRGNRRRSSSSSRGSSSSSSSICSSSRSGSRCRGCSYSRRNLTTSSSSTSSTSAQGLGFRAFRQPSAPEVKFRLPRCLDMKLGQWRAGGGGGGGVCEIGFDCKCARCARTPNSKHDPLMPVRESADVSSSFGLNVRELWCRNRNTVGWLR